MVVEFAFPNFIIRNLKMLEVHCSQLLRQGSVTYRPRAGCGAPRHFTQPATFFCHRSRSLFSFFNDRYAPINRRNDSHLLTKTFFCGLRHQCGRKKAMTFFFLDFATDCSEKRLELLAKTFFFSLRYRFVRKKA